MMEFEEILYSIFMVFLMIAWVWAVIAIIGDLFRSTDLKGWHKALWLLLLIIIPWFGVLLYLIVRGKGMTERNVKEEEMIEKMRQEYIRDVTSGSSNAYSAADEIAKMNELKKEGVITEEEFDEQKKKILSA